MKLVNILLLSVLLLGAANLFSADISCGELILEVLLNKDKEIQIKPSGTVFISETNAPLHRELRESFNISIANASTINTYGILNRTVPYTFQGYNDPALDPQDPLLRPYFTWKDNRFYMEYEKFIYEDISFHDYDEALKYCEETGSPIRSITQIPVVGAQAKVVTASGIEYYFELPLILESESDLSFKGQNLDYSGEFIIKAVGDELIVNHKLALEDYIAGVIQNEIGSGAPLEALKTQAVTARSHAISLLLYNRHKLDGYDLCNTTHCQVYKGKHLLNASITQAVHDTHNEILVHEGKIASTTYHSSSGGKTDSSVNIWRGSPYPYLMGVTVYPESESYDLVTESGARAWLDYKQSTDGMSSWERSALSWSRTISSKQLADQLSLDTIQSIEIVQRGRSGRILELKINGKTTVQGEFKIRQLFGGAPSSFFYIKGSYSLNNSRNAVYRPGASFDIVGKGSGHGVGMCQLGTLQRARSGATYDEILQHFYPGTMIYKEWLEHYE